jgi:hypothetical protein
VAPPLVGLAVKIKLLPAQTPAGFGEIVTAGVTLFDVIVIVLLVAVGLVRQVALLVIITVTRSPALRVEEV